MSPLQITFGLLAFIAITIVTSMVNTLVTLRNRFINAYAQIDEQLKRRYDLIPNMVETAKGYIKHERETLEAVITARNDAATANISAAANPGDPSAMHVLASSEMTLGGALGRLFALLESYPDLKANDTMLRLMEDLASTDNKVAFFRDAFNDAVMAYNTKRKMFPRNVISVIFRFNLAESFSIENTEKRLAPKIPLS